MVVVVHISQEQELLALYISVNVWTVIPKLPEDTQPVSTMGKVGLTHTSFTYLFFLSLPAAQWCYTEANISLLTWLQLQWSYADDKEPFTTLFGSNTPCSQI